MKENKIVLSLGSNLGNKEKNLQQAITELAKTVDVIKTSSVYITEPEDFFDQDDFLNQIIEIKTNKTPQDLLKMTQSIEKMMKRERTIEKGPRIIDIDIIFYKDLVLNDEKLVIPHPSMHLRNFVLIPLNEICPKIIHPKIGKSIKIILSALKSSKNVTKWIPKNRKTLRNT